MSQKPKTWLDPSHQVPDLTTTPSEGLFVVWQANRNSSLGTLAADEVMRRIVRGELVLMEETGRLIRIQK